MNSRPIYKHLPKAAVRLVRAGIPAICLAAMLPGLQAQNTAAIAEREIVRRQEGVLLAETAVRQAERALARNDLESAYVHYLDALEKIPEGAATTRVRNPVVKAFASTALKYAEDLIANGRFADAERVAKTVLLPQFDPENRAAVRLLSRLEQPDYFNKTITPGFAADRDEVNKFFVEAEGFFNAGRYDLAMKRYEQILLIDPYNKAARTGMERVQKQKSMYYGSAYNETRSRLLWLADRAWDRPLRQGIEARGTDSAKTLRSDTRTTEAISAKLNGIIIPRVDLRDTTVREAVQFLQQRSKDLDPSTDDPADKRGVNIVLKLAQPAAPATDEPSLEDTPVQGGSADTRVTLSLTNVPPLPPRARKLKIKNGAVCRLDCPRQRRNDRPRHQGIPRASGLHSPNDRRGHRGIHRSGWRHDSRPYPGPLKRPRLPQKPGGRIPRGRLRPVCAGRQQTHRPQ